MANQNNKRPLISDKTIIEAGIKEFLPQIIEWVIQDDDHIVSESEAEIMIEQLLSVYDIYKDGYMMAKDLDSKYYWNCDSDMVDLLDNLHNSVYKIHSKVVKQWVLENNIQPQFKIGNKVVIEHGNKFKKEEVIGEISRIYQDEAKYSVFCESLGHVREGNGTHGLIFSYENVKPLETEVII